MNHTEGVPLTVIVPIPGPQCSVTISLFLKPFFFLDYYWPWEKLTDVHTKPRGMNEPLQYSEMMKLAIARGYQVMTSHLPCLKSKNEYDPNYRALLFIGASCNSLTDFTDTVTFRVTGWQFNLMGCP